MLPIFGASLTGLTVTRKLLLADARPSLTVRVIVAEPLAFAAGVTVTVRSAPLPPRTTFASGTSAWLLLVAVTVNAVADVSASPTVNASAPVVVSSLMVWSPIVLMVGGAFTVSTKVSAAVSAPSLTVTVIVAVPVLPAAGVTVRVRFAPLPPKRMLASGTRVWLLLLPVTVSDPAAVSMSPTVKVIAPVAVSWLVVWSEMLLIVGAALPPVKNTASAPAVCPMLFCATAR